MRSSEAVSSFLGSVVEGEFVEDVSLGKRGGAIIMAGCVGVCAVGLWERSATAAR